MLIKSIDEFEEVINLNKAVLVYFSSNNCNVCHALKPKVFESARSTYPKLKLIEVNISNTPQIAATYSVLSAPTVIILLDKKEFIRKTRTFGVDELLGAIKRPYEILMS